MVEYKQLLGALAVAIGVIAYIPYVRDMFKGKTKPHAFSWFVWGVLTVIGFFAQISKGAGAGAWTAFFSAVLSFFTAGYALFKGERNITRTDWLSLLGAGLGLGLWAITRNPLYAIILIIVVDALGFVPTFRKSYSKPHQETLVSYLLNGLKFIPAIMAITDYNLTTVLYPAYLVIANLALVGMLVVRRRALAKTN